MLTFSPTSGVQKHSIRRHTCAITVPSLFGAFLPALSPQQHFSAFIKRSFPLPVCYNLEVQKPDGCGGDNLVHIAIIDTVYEIAVERDQHQWTKQITAPKTQSACLTRVARRVFKIEAI
jgi:hypothetical protein